MNQFEKNKQDYYDRVSSYDINYNIDLNGFNNDYNILNILLNPTNQRELDFADSVFLILQDISNIYENINYLDYDENNNEFIRYFSDYVSCVLNNESLKDKVFLIKFGENNKFNMEFNTYVIKNINSNDFSYEMYAKVIYDMMSAFANSNVLQTSLSRNGINLKSNEILFEKMLIQTINNSNENEKKDLVFSIDKEKILDFFTNLFNSFHEIANTKKRELK